MSDDPDDRAVAEARAAVTNPDGDPGQQQAAGTQPQGQQQRRDIRVPKARLDEALRHAAQLAQEVAYLKGAAEARTAQPVSQGQPQPPQQPPANPYGAIEAAIVTEQDRVVQAAGQFDEGAITMVQFKAVEMQAQNNIASLRERVMLHVVQAQQPAPTTSLADQDILNRHQAQMEETHPWVTSLTNAELQHLAKVARDEFAALGRPIESGPHETIRLRGRVAQLATKFGPDWYPGRQVAAQAAPPAGGTQTQPSNQQPQRGQQGATKLNLALNHPPQTNRAGTGANADVVTLDQVGRMTTEEIAALPAGTRARLLA